MSSEATEQRFIEVPRNFVFWSLIIHLGIPVFLLLAIGLEKLGINIFPNKKLNTVEIYQNFIQVDVVALPDELKNERFDIDPTLPVLEKPSTTKLPIEVEDKDTMAMEEEKKAAELKNKLEEKRAADEKEKKTKVEKANALKQMEREAQKEAALKAMKEKEEVKGRGKIAGNLMSQGTAVSGRVGTAKDRYSALVAQKVRQNFNIFAWQKKKGLAATVYIEITTTGRVKDKKLIKPSRDSVFDAAVLQAIDESQPLPVPEDMSLVSDGINLEFRPEN